MISYLTIWETLTGERAVTEIFEPRKPKQVTRWFPSLDDDTAYFSVQLYGDSLDKIRKVLWQHKTREEIAQIIRTMPYFNSLTKLYWKNQAYTAEYESELKEKIIAQEPIWIVYAMIFDLAPRTVFFSINDLNKNEISELLRANDLFTEEIPTKIRSEYVIFKFDDEGKLISISSR
ncbi:hypothetical protein AADZ91_07010 [Colwelliaceae bacterium 6441]